MYKLIKEPKLAMREMRKRAGLTQEKLAEKSMVSRTAISWWELGRVLPDANNLLAVCEVLNCSTDEYLGWGQADV